MRFVWIPPQYDDKNQIALFDPSLYVQDNAIHIDPSSGNPIPDTGNPLEGMAYASNHTIPKGGWDDRGIMPEPRIGFAWDPTGDHKGVLRGGFGMSHDREEGNLVFNPAFNNPLLETTPSISSPTYLNFSQISNAPQSSPGTLSSITGVQRSGQVPTVYSYSLGVQREAGWGISYDIAYVGTESRHLITNYDINTIPYGSAFSKSAASMPLRLTTWLLTGATTSFRSPSSTVRPTTTACRPLCSAASARALPSARFTRGRSR